MSRSDFERLVATATGLVSEGRRAILGIAGAPGAGKTTFTEQLSARLRQLHGEDWVAHLPMDGFHLADAQLDRLGAADRKGAPDTFDGLGYGHLLRRVRTCSDETIYAPGFERDLEQPIAAALVIPATAQLIITEGNYLLLDEPPWPAARGELAQVWYVTADQEVRLKRLIERHVRFGKSADAARAWVLRSDEANAELVAARAASADLVVRNEPDGWRCG